MKKPVYNLEFRSWCHEMTVFGYRFTRVADYRERLLSLQHLVQVYSEFDIRRNTGQHAVTAYVESMEPEKRAVLQGVEDSRSALSDILLLLSIFTGRRVFVLDKVDDDSAPVLICDPRGYFWGHVLSCSIPYRASDTPDPYDIGFEEGLNRVYQHLRSENWQRMYEHGHFLWLLDNALRQDTLAAAFLQCWTIWEHLFSVLNQTWMSKQQLHRLDASEKLRYLLVQYGLRDQIHKSDRHRIEALAEIRNRLVHYGRFPERGSVHDDAVLFVRLTEFILAKILGLLPSDAFNTMQKLEEFLDQKTEKK